MRVVPAHPLYNIYYNIYGRCYNKNRDNYKYYGGKGVVICDEWLNNPKLFIEWALQNGWRRGLQIDKDIKSKELGINPPIYSPECCSIISKNKNNLHTSQNRYFTVNGVTKNITEWGRLLGCDNRIIDSRIRRGWSIEDAVTLPSKRN